MSTPQSSSSSTTEAGTAMELHQQVLSEKKNIDQESSVIALSNEGDQPTVLEGPDRNDPRNPQNWSPWKKRLIFLALMSSSILADG